MKINHLRLFVVSLVIFLWSCDKSTNDPQPQVLVSSTLVKEYSKDEFIKALGTTGQQVALFIRSGVRQYKIVYKTKTPDGTEIQASGALTVPVGLTETLPLLSYQHGTIFNDSEAPSYLGLTGEGFTASFLATLGYIVSAPDYIGYGSSKNLPHTYEHREGLATASLDMLRAVREVIAKEKLNWNNNLYIAGYSEGGFATLSLQKKMEETAKGEFNLKASSCGAGAYNKTLSFKTLLSTKSSGNPTHNASYIWVLLTYDNLYKLNRPMSSYFVEPYATQIQAQKQNVSITKSLDEIVSTATKNGIINGTDTALLSAIADNDIFDWKPTTPTRLYHGDKDTYVPYFNTKTAFDAMQKRGATNVELKTIPGGDHGTSVQEFLLGTLEFFSLYK